MDKAQQMKWIEAVLTNDETSTDDELIQYFMKEGLMTRKEATQWVMVRPQYLNQI